MATKHPACAGGFWSIDACQLLTGWFWSFVPCAGEFPADENEVDPGAATRAAEPLGAIETEEVLDAALVCGAPHAPIGEARSNTSRGSRRYLDANIFLSESSYYLFQMKPGIVGVNPKFI